MHRIALPGSTVQTGPRLFYSQRPDNGTVTNPHKLSAYNLLMGVDITSQARRVMIAHPEDAKTSVINIPVPGLGEQDPISTNYWTKLHSLGNGYFYVTNDKQTQTAFTHLTKIALLKFDNSHALASVQYDDFTYSGTYGNGVESVLPHSFCSHPEYSSVAYLTANYSNANNPMFITLRIYKDADAIDFDKIRDVKNGTPHTHVLVTKSPSGDLIYRAFAEGMVTPIIGAPTESYAIALSYKAADQANTQSNPYNIQLYLAYWDPNINGFQTELINTYNLGQTGQTTQQVAHTQLVAHQTKHVTNTRYDFIIYTLLQYPRTTATANYRMYSYTNVGSPLNAPITYAVQRILFSPNAAYQDAAMLSRYELIRIPFELRTLTDDKTWGYGYFLPNAQFCIYPFYVEPTSLRFVTYNRDSPVGSPNSVALTQEFVTEVGNDTDYPDIYCFASNYSFRMTSIDNSTLVPRIVLDQTRSTTKRIGRIAQSSSGVNFWY